MFQLKIYNKNPDKLIMRFSSVQRLFFSLLAVFLFSGIIYSRISTPENSVGLPAAVGFICLLGALYTETWIFDKTKRQVEHRFGLILLNKKNRYAWDDIREIRLGSFIKGSLSSSEPDPEKKKRHLKPYSTLSIVTDLEVKDIEMVSRRLQGKLEKKALSISTFCDIPINDRSNQ